MSSLPEWKLISPTNAPGADYNPPGRVADKKVSALSESMAKYGLVSPVVITREGRVIDGHRRCAAAAMLGWDSILAVVSNQIPEEVYASANATSRKHSGNEMLYVFLSNRSAVDPRKRAIYEEAAKTIGRAGLKKILDAGMGINVFMTAKRINSYVGDNIDLAKVVNWLLEHRVSGIVVKHISAKRNKNLLVRLINLNKPLTL